MLRKAKKPSGATGRPLKKKIELAGKECSAKDLVATAAAAVFPFHLDHPVVAAKGLVELGAVGRRLCRTELEVALVRILIAGRVKPGIEIRIGDSFFCFMSNYVAHSVRAAHTR